MPIRRSAPASRRKPRTYFNKFLEAAVSVGNLAGARSLAFEAQDMLLQMERETIEDLRRRSYDKQPRSI